MKRTAADTFIQWKGTDVCMDFHCKCGEHMHFDCDFLYHVKCCNCGEVYKIGSRVSATPVTPEERARLEADNWSLWTNNEDEDTVRWVP